MTKKNPRAKAAEYLKGITGPSGNVASVGGLKGTVDDKGVITFAMAGRSKKKEDIQVPKDIKHAWSKYFDDAAKGETIRDHYNSDDRYYYEQLIDSVNKMIDSVKPEMEHGTKRIIDLNIRHAMSTLDELQAKLPELKPWRELTYDYNPPGERGEDETEDEYSYDSLDTLIQNFKRMK